MSTSDKSSSRKQPQSETALQLRSARAWLECLADSLKLDRDGTAMLFPAEMPPDRQIVDVEVTIAQLGDGASMLGDMGGRRVTLARSLEQIDAALAEAVSEPAVIVDLGTGRWIVTRGAHAGREALYLEPAPAAGEFMTRAPVLGPPDTVQPGTVCLRFDRTEAVTYLRWFLAVIEDPLRTPADPADFAAAKWMRAWPADPDDDSPPDPSALSRALSMHDALPDEHRPTDSEPLRNCLPGIWPSVGDVRASLAERDDLLRHRVASEAPGWTYQGPYTEGAHLSDAVVASRVRMLMRGDLDHEAVCCMARDRIRDLSREVTRLRALVPGDA